MFMTYLTIQYPIWSLHAARCCYRAELNRVSRMSTVDGGSRGRLSIRGCIFGSDILFNTSEISLIKVHNTPRLSTLLLCTRPLFSFFSFNPPLLTRMLSFFPLGLLFLHSCFQPLCTGHLFCLFGLLLRYQASFLFLALFDCNSRRAFAVNDCFFYLPLPFNLLGVTQV